MNKLLYNNIGRAIILIILQVVIFKHISLSFGDFTYVHFFIYPLIILLIPFRVPKPVILVAAFLVGIIVDIFYDSPGVHASALVFTAYIRGFIIHLIEPYEGYNVDDGPNVKDMGFQWFFIYSTILLALHMLFYFSIEHFSVVYFFEIFMNSISSFIVSYIIILLIIIIFKPK